MAPEVDDEWNWKVFGSLLTGTDSDGIDLSKCSWQHYLIIDRSFGIRYDPNQVVAILIWQVYKYTSGDPGRLTSPF